MQGAYKAVRKDGSEYFRSSVTYRGKHISLGSYATESEASQAYLEAGKALNSDQDIDSYSPDFTLEFEKYVILINFRDNEVYIKNPIYLMKRYFLYYCDPETVFKFDIDDLFFYSSHHISRRGGHFFVADYGMQLSLNARYGIRRHAVRDRDYRFINGDPFDYRYENIEIINRYFGVERFTKNGREQFRAKILVNGTIIIGTYPTEAEAAIAYNKAADLITRRLPEKSYEVNYIDSVSPRQYAELYTGIQLSPAILKYEKYFGDGQNPSQSGVKKPPLIDE
ncbi:MAG: hypothetical protein IJR19_03970 [Lachnospiraceae bacterium]|nr:hypothetical protein [Lachnospiraceae bacterium]